MGQNAFGKTSILPEKIGFPKKLCPSKPKLSPWIAIHIPFKKKKEIRLEGKPGAIKNIERSNLKLK